MKLNMVCDGHLGGYIAGGDPGTWCPNLWSWAVDEFGARSVLDVGCGEGHASRYFQKLGCQVLGIDGCRTAIEHTVVPGHVALHDFCSGSYQASQPVDLVWSCEFLEHVEERYLPHILQTFAQARKAILVTHAFPGQEDGHHHVNCQSSRYWIRHIEALGFGCVVDKTHTARRTTLADYPGINHFARSGLVFVRTTPIDGAAAARPSSAAGAWWKDVRINVGFRMSKACRSQRRRRKAQKRAEKQTGEAARRAA